MIIINSTLLLLLTFFSHARADEDIKTYCFDSEHTLQKVARGIDFLKLESDRIQQRTSDFCLDIVTPESRSKLYEKMIWKIHPPIEDRNLSASKDYCHFELIESKSKLKEDGQIILGQKLKLEKGQETEESLVKTEFVVANGKSTVMSIQEKKIQVECVKVKTNLVQLTFYYEEKNRAQINATLTLSPGEVVNASSISKNLNELERKFGIKGIEEKSTTGFENIKYEIKVL